MTIRIYTWDELYELLVASGEWGDPDDIDKDVTDFGYALVMLDDGAGDGVEAYVKEEFKEEFE